MDEASSSGQRDQQEWRERFLAEILKSESEKSTHFNVLTEEKYLELIQEVQEAETAKKKTPLQLRRLKRFNVLDIGGTKKLIARNKENENIKFYLSADELYDVIDAAHVAVGHGGRDKMFAETSKQYANITKDMICLFLSMCEVCQQKKTKKKQVLITKPSLYSEINTRCQVDLIDFQAQPDGKFKFVMVYQDYQTKFILLRPLETQKPEEVAYNLNDIFLTIGAPCILQSNNGREFVDCIIKELKSLWPELKIVPGNLHNTQDQSSIEKPYQDIVNIISSWLKENQTTKWSERLKYIQFEKNRTFHLGIKQSPYKAMFGLEPKIGLSSTSLPAEVLQEIQEEEDLQKYFQDENKNENENENENKYGNNKGNKNEDETEYENELSEKILDSIDDNSVVERNMEEARVIAVENLGNQAKRMKVTLDKSRPAVKIGDIVTIPISDITKENLGNIVGIILQINDEGLYQIGTKHGILPKFYHRTEFDICAQKFLNVEEVDRGNEISLKTAAVKHSVDTGQNLIQCNCTKNCSTNNCRCNKKSIRCTSKCHQSLGCSNK